MKYFMIFSVIFLCLSMEANGMKRQDSSSSEDSSSSKHSSSDETFIAFKKQMPKISRRNSAPVPRDLSVKEEKIVRVPQISPRALLKKESKNLLFIGSKEVS